MLEQTLQNWITNLSRVRRYSPHTIEAYRQDFAGFHSFLMAHMGETITISHLENLKPTDIRAWMANRLDEGFSPRSTARAISVIRNFYKFLSQETGNEMTPLSFMRSPRIKVGLPRPLSIHDTHKLLEDMNTPSLDEEIKGNKPEWVKLRNKALFTLLYATGMRISEGLSLRRICLPLGNHLVIKGKGSKERLIPILEEVKKAIMTYIDACPIPLNPQDVIFVGVKGNPLHPHVAQKVIRDYRRLVGLPETVTPHALRHSCATHLLGNEGDLRTIQELLGHSSLTSTQIYTNVDQMQLMKTFKKAHPRSK